MAKPEPRLIRTFQDAEQAALDWLRFYGFLDVRLTPDGRDQGVDVESESVVAQVKAEVGKTSRPVVQQIYGEASLRGVENSAVFSLGGFTDDALIWAEEAGVALFTLDLTGEPVAANAAAVEIATPRRTFDPPPDDLPVRERTEAWAKIVKGLLDDHDHAKYEGFERFNLETPASFNDFFDPDHRANREARHSVTRDQLRAARDALAECRRELLESEPTSQAGELELRWANNSLNAFTRRVRRLP